jgi:glutamyl-tRNA reductase
MSLVVTGLSHHTSTLALREQLHFPEDAMAKAFLQLRKDLGPSGAVILSTCNRVEIYVHHDGDHDEVHEGIISFMCQWHGIDESTCEESLYTYANEDAIRHLFRVASSLDSLVVGEQQILGQVHDAYLVAHVEQATDKVISSMFQRAFAIAKKVRSKTKIGAGKVSVSSVAVDLAVSIFDSLEGKTVMTVGSGEMGELTLKHLAGRGVKHMIMANRSIEKAQELARQFDGEAIALADMATHLHRADIVISSTASPDYVLGPDHVKKALKQRAKSPIFVIDLAVPRDVDPAINDMDSVFLYDMDSLQEAADANLAARRDEIARCMEIVEAGADKFWGWTRGLAAEPAIVSMVGEVDSIRESELKKTLASLPHLADNDRDEIEYLTKRIVNKILQQPMRQLKDEVSNEEDPRSVLDLFKRLFGLKEIS